MFDLNLQQPVTDSVEVDAETLSAIDRGIEAADNGRTVPLDELRRLLSKWLSN